MLSATFANYCTNFFESYFGPDKNQVHQNAYLIFVDPIFEELIHHNPILHQKFFQDYSHQIITIQNLNSKWISPKRALQLFSSKQFYKETSTQQQQKSTPKKEEEEEFDSWNNDFDQEEEEEEEQPVNANTTITHQILNELHFPPIALFCISELTTTIQKQLQQILSHYEFFDHIEVITLYSENLTEWSQLHMPNRYISFGDFKERIEMICLQTLIPYTKRRLNQTLIEEPQVTVNIRCFALHATLFDESVFLLPNCNSCFPLLSLSQQQSHQELQQQPLSIQIDFNHLAESLASICKLLDCKLDIYSLGNSAQLIAETMHQSLPLFNFKNKASVLVVDRTLDLITALSHSENFLDRMLNANQRSNSISFDLDGLNTDLRSLLNTKQETLELLKFNLMLIAKQSKINLDEFSLQASTENQLINLFEIVSQDANFCLHHSQWMDLFAVVFETLEKEKFEKEMAGIEKVMLWNMTQDAEPSQVLETVLLELVKKKKDLNTWQVLKLCCMIYSSISSDLEMENETLLKPMLLSLLLKQQNDEFSTLLQKFKITKGKEEEEDTINTKRAWEPFVDHCIQMLKQIQMARNKFTAPWQELLLTDEEDSSTMTSAFEPLLHKLATKIVRKQLIPEVKQHHSMLSSISSKLGSFFSTSPQAHKQQGHKILEEDTSVCIVFVVGGVTCWELALMQDAFRRYSSKHPIQFLFGSTQIVQGDAVLQTLLEQSNTK